MKTNLNWQRRAIIIFSIAIFLLSIILTILAVREVEREKLVRKVEIEEEQQRLTELLIERVKAFILEVEGRISKLINISQTQSHENAIKEVCQRIAEGEELITEIFLINKRGVVSFPLGKLLFLLPQGEEIRKKPSIEIEAHSILKKAEIFEFKTKNYPLAIESYQKLLDETSDKTSQVRLLSCIGRCYVKLGNSFKAIEAYKTAIEAQPQSGLGYFYLGALYERIGQRQKAYEVLKKSVELDDKNADTLNYLGYMYAEDGIMLDQAQMFIEKALEMDPDNGAYIDSLGWVYFKKGMVEEALAQLEKASSLLEDAEIFEHLGDIYQVKGENQKAKKVWEKALELEPERESVKERLKKLNNTINVSR